MYFDKNIITAWMFFYLVIFVIATSLNRLMPVDEKIKKFIDNECLIGQCDLLEIEWPHVKKRSIDNKISFPINIFGKLINLNLVPSKNFLVGPNTPVYYLDTQYDSLRLKVKTHIFREEKWELYEDEKEFTSIYVKIYSNGSKQIQFGYIGSELFTIEPVANWFPYSSRSHYLARAHNETYKIVKIPVLNENLQSIPEVVYPELLLIIDYQMYAKYNKNQLLFPYLLTFWNIVNIIFRPLRNPEIVINISGIMIAQDEKVIHYMSGNHYKYEETSYINYGETIFNVSAYLFSRQNIIPPDTYDIFVISTTKQDERYDFYTTYGKAISGGACHINKTEKKLYRSIILYEKSYVTNINAAAHEMAHSLGVRHHKIENKNCIIPRAVLSSSIQNLNTNWSECSTNILHQLSRNSTFSCLYNKPNFTNPLLEEEDDPLTSNGKWLEFYMTANKDFRELINPREFYSKKAIEVSFKNNKIVVQLVDKSTFTRKNISIEYNIQKIVPDYEKIIIDLTVINRMKDINIFYKNKSIHVYQEIHEEVRGNNQPLPPLYVSANSEDIITIEVPVFDRNKLVAVFYENNKLIVTQKIKIEDDKEFSGCDVIDLNNQYTISDDTKVYIRPFQLNLDSILRIYHKKTSIYISQIEN